MKDNFTVYFKALLKGNIAPYDGKTKYRAKGWTIHPSPDKSPSMLCGDGFHLAKTLPDALSLCKTYDIVWIARAGNILAEDEQKVRTDKVKLLKQVPQDIITRIKNASKGKGDGTRREEYRCYHILKDLVSTISCASITSPPLPPIPKLEQNPLCGIDWLEKHYFDFSQEDIDNQSIVISIDDKNFHLRAKDNGKIKQLVKLNA